MSELPTKPIVLYWDTLSGHAHRARLGLGLLGLPHRIERIDLLSGAQKSPAYLAINPLGQVPAIDDDGVVVFDSNAILTYLALKYDATRQWLPVDPGRAATVVRYLSLAAGPIAFGPALARLGHVFGAKVDLDEAHKVAARALTALERGLAAGNFLLGEVPSIADIAAYSYVAHAPEGGITLDPYPAVRAWLGRFEALPGFEPMQRTTVGLQTAA